MTDDDRPTTPGTIEAADRGREDVHNRETIPAPEPLHITIRAPGPLHIEQASDSTPTPAVPMRLAADGGSGADESETLRDSEVETWRPPAPPQDAAPAKVVTTSASATDSSSIAPRELSQRPAQPPHGERRVLGLLAATVLFGIGVIAVQRAEHAPQPTRSAASGAELDTAATPPTQPPGRDRVEAAVRADAPSVATAAPTPEPAVADLTTPAASDVDRQPRALAATADRAGVTGTGARRRALRARASQTLPAGDLPETPSREAIAAALHDLHGAIELCSDGRSGVAELDLTIRGSGTLAHALVGGDFAGTPQGSCIARTLRAARFAPFQKPKFRILYKLML